MGLRDRLKQQVQRAIGHTPAPPSPRPPRPPAVAPPAAPPAPKAAPPAPKAAPPAPKAAPPAPKAPPPAPVAAPPAPSDAPVRQAHHRPDFVATALALRVRVHDPGTDAWLSFPCEPGETVLEAAERAGLVLPFSCRSGGCLSCTGLLQQGEAEQGDQYVLEEEQLQAGFRLLCCTTVRTDAVFLGHQEKNVQ